MKVIAKTTFVTKTGIDPKTKGVLKQEHPPGSEVDIADEAEAKSLVERGLAVWPPAAAEPAAEAK